jgi:hypothetical protein
MPGPAHLSGRRTAGDHDHPGREDRLRRQPQVGHGDADMVATGQAGKPIKAGKAPTALALVP